MRTPIRSTRWLGRAFALFGVLALAAAFLAPSAQADGNNGTVKIDKGELDGNSNQPHVGCEFFVEWFGFDDGATSTVTFTMQAPTDSPTTPGSPTSVAYGPYTLVDGAGNQQFDIYDLLKNFTPQANQGFHVKVEVNTTWSNGDDSKFKTFWVSGCKNVVGSITLDKVLTGDAAPANDPAFSFDVESTDSSATLTNPAIIKASDDPLTVAEGVPLGSTVTITENPTNGASSVFFSVDGGAAQPGPSVDVVITGETPVHVLFTNQFDSTPQFGSVTLDKVLGGAGAPANDPTFTFTVTSDDPGAILTSPVDVKASEAAKTVATHVALGKTVTITETAANGAASISYTVDGGAAQSGPSVDVTVSSTTPVVVVVTNTFTEEVAPTSATTAPTAQVLGEELARTGKNDGLLVFLGITSLLTGAVLLLMSRRLRLAAQ